VNSREGVVALIAEIRSAAESDKTVGALLDAFAERVRAEPGNLVFAAWRAANEPSRFLVYEEYADDVAFRDHLSSEHNRTFNESIASHVAGDGAVLTRLVGL
jgi:autoinducer 2-degrading protein